MTNRWRYWRGRDLLHNFCESQCVTCILHFLINCCAWCCSLMIISSFYLWHLKNLYPFWLTPHRGTEICFNPCHHDFLFSFTTKVISFRLIPFHDWLYLQFIKTFLIEPESCQDEKRRNSWHQGVFSCLCHEGIHCRVSPQIA